MSAFARQDGARIGVFDSGVGGLTVLRAIHELLPEIGLDYIADTAHAPYGERGSEFIVERSLTLAGALIADGARLVVVACNTATTQAIHALRQRWPDLLFVGVEPGIKPAVQQTRNGRIGVMATRATLSSERYRQLVAQHAGEARIFSQPCPGLADLIETADLDSPAVLERVAQSCAPLSEAGVDTVLLGCTHYPLVQAHIQARLGEHVRLLNIESAVARQAARLWRHWREAHPEEGVAQGIQLASTGDPLPLQRLAREALGWPLEARQRKL